jgi:hypothetical protein
VLLADRLGSTPPALDGFDALEALVAEHYADLWRLGLHRLAEHSAGVAAHCRDHLTRICRDGDRPIAAWVADPAQVAQLLGALVDVSLDEQTLLSRALSWTDSRQSLVIWPESDHGDRVRLSIANAAFDPVVVQFNWTDSPDEVPIAVPIDAGAVERVVVDRPPSSPPPGAFRGADDARQVLRVSAGGRESFVRFAPAVVGARPPGVQFPVFLMSLTLAEIQAAVQRNTPAQRMTRAELRRVSGRWEVFFECRRGGAVLLPADLGTFGSYTDVRGVESVTLLIGGAVPAVALTVPESGPYRLFHGEDPGVAVHRRSYIDRWYCRVELPESWIEPFIAAPMQFGCMRAHGDAEAVETTPKALAPWRREPARVAIDLRAWEDLPR